MQVKVLTKEKMKLQGKLQAATTRNADVILFLDRLKPILDFFVVDLVKASLFDEALSSLDEKVSRRVLKCTTSCAAKVPEHFVAMTPHSIV